MSNFEIYSCPYCGGKLEHIKDNMWSCPYCGKECAQVQDHSSNKLNNSIDEEISGTILFISVPGKSSHIEFDKKMVLTISIRRRATLADKYPMELLADIDGRKTVLATELENIGKGSVTIVRRKSNVEFSSEGNVKLFLNGEEISYGSFHKGDELVLGSVKIKID